MSNEYRAEWMRQYRRKNPRVTFDTRLRFAFGISADDYDAMLAAQGGGCAMCGTSVPGGKGRFHVDHDHACCPGKRACGKCVRGLLCVQCNAGLGLFGDDVLRLRKAIDYVESWRALRGDLQESVA